MLSTETLGRWLTARHHQLFCIRFIYSTQTHRLIAISSCAKPVSPQATALVAPQSESLVSMPDSVPRDALEGFELSEVLNQDPLNKSITLLGTFSGRAGPAIVQLTRRPFDAEKLCAKATISRATCREKQFENDVYSKVSWKCIKKMVHGCRIS